MSARGYRGRGGESGVRKHVVWDPEARKQANYRRAAYQRAEERRWAALAGPVTVRRVGDPAPESSDGDLAQP